MTQGGKWRLAYAMNTRTRAALALAFLSAAALGSCSRREAAPFRGAHVILLSLDTVRADAVAGFGAPVEATPNLYLVGQEGIRFPTAIAASHITAPSHASLLTGVSPFVHGVSMAKRGGGWPIPEKLPTLAERFQAAGYRTAAFTDGIQLLPELGFARGFDLYDKETIGLAAKRDRIRDFVEQSGEAPIFLFLHTYRAHQPYRPPLDLASELIQSYRGIYAAPVREIAWLDHQQSLSPSALQMRLGRALSGEAARSPDDRKFFRRLYDAGVTGLDREVGQALGLLRQLGLYDMSLLAITSDHGEAFFEHDRDSHHDVFEECLRVPLILRLPGGLGAGRSLDATFPAVDLAPTLLDLAGLAAPGSLEGRSWAPWVREGQPEERPAVSSWHYVPDARWPSGCSVRDRRGKLLMLDQVEEAGHPAVANLGVTSYFDRIEDPHERTDLAVELRPHAKELLAAHGDFRAHWKLLREHYGANADRGIDLDAEAIEALRAVGYNR